MDAAILIVIPQGYKCAQKCVKFSIPEVLWMAKSLRDESHTYCALYYIPQT
jgi:hypothetical protein